MISLRNLRRTSPCGIDPHPQAEAGKGIKSVLDDTSSGMYRAKKDPRGGVHNHYKRIDSRCPPRLRSCSKSNIPSARSDRERQDAGSRNPGQILNVPCSIAVRDHADRSLGYVGETWRTSSFSMLQTPTTTRAAAEGHRHTTRIVQDIAKSDNPSITSTSSGDKEVQQGAAEESRRNVATSLAKGGASNPQQTACRSTRPTFSSSAQGVRRARPDHPAAGGSSGPRIPARTQVE